MALPPITIPDLDPAISPIDPNADYLIIRQALNDKKVTANQILQSLTDELQLISGPISPMTWTGVTVQPTINYGRYTRIKDLVFITINVILINTVVQTLANPVKMLDLPFPSRTDTNFICSLECAVGNMTSAAGKQLSGRIDPNSTVLNIHAVEPDGYGDAFFLGLADGGQLTITGFYFAQ